MRQKSLILLILLFLLPVSVCSQTLNLLGQEIVFGSAIEVQKSEFKQNCGQVEFEYSYINLYECENSQKGFYNNKLVYFYYNAYDNNPYPVCEEIENILMALTPYKQYTEFDQIGAFIESYKTDEFYISRTSSRMNTDYTFIPVKFLEEIRLNHPNFLVKQF